MYTPIEERIKQITKGVCPYKRKACDGLCNNCGIMASHETTRKTVPAKNGTVITWNDMNSIEDRCIYDGE